MRHLVFSDCHGNRFGLQAVLDAAAGEYDALLCLGDTVGYGAHPNECCELVRQAGASSSSAIYLMGNHDAAALGKIDTRWFNPIARFAIEWTARELTAENKEWLESLQPQMADEKANFQAVHASLRQPVEEYIVNAEIAMATLQLMGRPLCFYGHTHVADCYELRSGEARGWLGSRLGRRDNEPDLRHGRLPDGGLIEMDEEAVYLINPGSCGQPRDGNPQARYAIFDDAERTVEVRAVDYDIIAARQAVGDAGLPIPLGDRLLVGR